MKKPNLFAIALSLLAIGQTASPVLARISPAQAEQKVALEGAWEGALDVGGPKLRLVLKISKEKDGSLSATMDSLDQNAMDLPVSSITLDGDNLRFEMKAIGGLYDGKLNKERSEVAGTWRQGDNSLPLNFKRAEKKSEGKSDETKKPEPSAKPQEPKKPYPYDEEEVSYENKAGGVKLAGALTLPRVKGPFPAVILITGSGAQDRNEALLGHKPFLVLADHLTRKGIAVLRVDDRGVGGSTGSITTSTSEDFAGDVLTGIEFLKTRKEINAKQIGLIGHSEGGLIAPMVAARSSEVAFIVLMAGPGLRGEEILYLQGALIAKANGATDEAITRSRATQEAIFTIVKEEKDNAAAEKRIRENLPKLMEGMTEEQKKTSGSGAAVEAQLKMVLTPWFRYFLAYDPKAALMKVRCPVLALNGEKDLQVPPDEDLKAIDQTLSAARNPDYKVVKLPGLNHLFQTSKTGSPLEYAEIQETISPAALDTMSNWILKHTR